MPQGRFSRFLRELAADWRGKYPFIGRLSVSAGDRRIPKASTFDLGRSPVAGKYVLVNFQASPKPWEVGCFTINVNLSQEPAVVARSVAFGREEYSHFVDGYYRLTIAAGEKDTWWCLQRREDGAARESKLVDYWEPGRFEPEEVAIAECLVSVTSAVERLVLVPLYGNSNFAS